MIAEAMTMGEAASLAQFAPIRKYFFSCRESSRKKFENFLLKAATNAEGKNRILAGLNRLQELAQSGRKLDYTFWSEEDCRREPDRADTGLLFFPGKAGAPFVLLCAGGAYQSVCSALEAFPAAAELNAAGYNAFVLTYRVRQAGLLPKPMDDAKQALRFILAHADTFQVAKKYAVMGFSAGAHLASELATDNFGVEAPIPSPAAMLLCYGLYDVRTQQGNPLSDAMLASMQGDRFTAEDVSSCLHITAKYPPTCLWQCEDDETVSFENYHNMCAALQRAGVHYKAFSYPMGGHGMMQPHPAEQDNWMQVMIDFLNEVGFTA